MSEAFTQAETRNIKAMKYAAAKIMVRSHFAQSLAMLHEHVVLAGGWFAKFIRGENQRNVDIFILCSKDRHRYEEYRSDLMARLFKQNKKLSTEIPNLPKEMMWEVMVDQTQKPKVRYIFSKAENRKELIASFDFIHCTISYCQHTNMLYMTPAAYHAAKNKVLIANGKVEHTQKRLEKFAIEGGYKYGHGCNVISTIDARQNAELNPGSEYETYHYSFEDDPE